MLLALVLGCSRTSLSIQTAPVTSLGRPNLPTVLSHRRKVRLDVGQALIVKAGITEGFLEAAARVASHVLPSLSPLSNPHIL